MPTKQETKSVKAEIRALKKSLNDKAKAHIKECQALRKTIVKATKKIEQKAGELGDFELATDRRIAILEGRLNS